MKRRIIPIILSVVMLLSMFPIGVFAAGFSSDQYGYRLTIEEHNATLEPTAGSMDDDMTGATVYKISDCIKAPQFGGSMALQTLLIVIDADVFSFARVLGTGKVRTLTTSNYNAVQNSNGSLINISEDVSASMCYLHSYEAYDPDEEMDVKTEEWGIGQSSITYLSETNEYAVCMQPAMAVNKLGVGYADYKAAMSMFVYLNKDAVVKPDSIRLATKEEAKALKQTAVAQIHDGDKLWDYEAHTAISGHGEFTDTAVNDTSNLGIGKEASAQTPTINSFTASPKKVTNGQKTTLTVEADAVTDGGTLTYEFFKNTTSSTTGGILLENPSNATSIQDTPVSGAATYYYCKVTNTLGDKTAEAYSEVVAVTAEAEATAAAPVITGFAPDNATVTNGGSTHLRVTANAPDNGKLSYTFYSNTTNNKAGATTLETNATGVMEVTPANNTTTYYYCTVTNTKNGVAATKDTDIVSVTASAAPVQTAETPNITNIAANPEAVTLGGSSTLTVTANVSDRGTLTYEFYENTTNSNTGGKLLSAASQANSISVKPAQAGPHYYYCKVTNTVTGKTAASKTSSVVTVTAQEQKAETPGNVVLNGPTNVKNDTRITLTASAAVSDGGTLTYEFFQGTGPSDTTNGVSLGTASIANTIEVTPDKDTKSYYYCVVTNTVAAGGTSLTASKASNVLTVTASAKTTVPEPKITTQPTAPQDAMVGLPFTLSVAAEADNGTLSYQWYKNTVQNTSNGEPIRGATNAEYKTSHGNTTTVYYYCVVSNRWDQADDPTPVPVTSDIVAVSAKASQPGSFRISVSAGNGKLGISWKEPPTYGADVTGYSVVVSAKSDYSSPVYNKDVNETKTVVDGLTNGTKYYIKVTANSTAGNTVSVASATPKKPSDQTVTLTVDTQATPVTGENNTYEVKNPAGGVMGRFQITDAAGFPVTDIRNIPKGTLVTFTAQPREGYAFVRWIITTKKNAEQANLLSGENTETSLTAPTITLSIDDNTGLDAEFQEVRELPAGSLRMNSIKARTAERDVTLIGEDGSQGFTGNIQSYEMYLTSADGKVTFDLSHDISGAAITLGGNPVSFQKSEVNGVTFYDGSVALNLADGDYCTLHMQKETEDPTKPMETEYVIHVNRTTREMDPQVKLELSAFEGSSKAQLTLKASNMTFNALEATVTIEDEAVFKYFTDLDNQALEAGKNLAELDTNFNNLMEGLTLTNMRLEGRTLHFLFETPDPSNLIHIGESTPLVTVSLLQNTEQAHTMEEMLKALNTSVGSMSDVSGFGTLKDNMQNDKETSLLYVSEAETYTISGVVNSDAAREWKEPWPVSFNVYKTDLDGDKLNDENIMVLKNAKGILTYKVPLGVFAVEMKADGFLSCVKTLDTDSKFADEEQKLLRFDTFTLLSGDADGNGIINADDRQAVVNAFWEALSEGKHTKGGIEYKVDYNQDDVANILDLSRVLTNFGKTSATAY